VLKVHPSGYYAWLKKPYSDRHYEEQRLLKLIRESYDASGRIYGSPRIHCDLRELGESCSKGRVERIMRKYEIQAIRGYKKPWYQFKKPSVVAPNHVRQQFSVEQPNCIWVTDITYIRTHQGWLYLAAVMDLYSRKVIGWSMKSTLAKEIVLDALLMAIWRRKPEREVIIHSDQGSQFSSDEWQRFCLTHQLKPSMSRRGNCYDNAAIESFFSSLKKEKIRKHIYKTRNEAKADIFDYIEVFYNRARRHQYLGNVSPEQFEVANL
jgi:putative transposase